MVDNMTIMANAWLSGSNDFQQRVPDPTQAGLQATADAIFAPNNDKIYTEFVDTLIRRIGYTYVRGNRWENILSFLKGPKLYPGASIQEIATSWIKAHSYNDSDSSDLFKVFRPDAYDWYHVENRRDFYPITINREELRAAFMSDDGLNRYIAQVMQNVINSMEYDEYRIMLQNLAIYENSAPGGFFKHKLSAVPDDEKSGKEFLKAIRTYAGKLRFPSTQYHNRTFDTVPTFANPEELILFVTPEIQASIDVDTLSGIFQIDKAELNTRIVVVDEFPIPDCVAILTTPDLFVVSDTLNEVRSFDNPRTLNLTYYYHIWQVQGISPFVPTILFTTAEGTETPKITVTPSSLTASVEPSTIKAGDKAKITCDLEGSIVASETGIGESRIQVKPDACTYQIVTSGETPLNKRTYVDADGVLHTQKSLEAGDTLTITCVSTYINPSGATSEYTDDVTVTIE